MDPAVKTNLNGINTLTKKLNTLTGVVTAISDQLNKINLSPINSKLEVLEKGLDLVNTRIRTLKGNNVQEQINANSQKMRTIDDKIKMILSSISDLSKKRDEVTSFNCRVGREAEQLSSDLVKLESNDAKLSKKLDELIKLYADILYLQEKIQIVDSIGPQLEEIQKNAAKIVKNTKQIESNGIQINTNASNIRFLGT